MTENTTTTYAVAAEFTFADVDTDGAENNLTVATDVAVDGRTVLTIRRADGDFYSVATDVAELEGFARDLLELIASHRD